MSAGRVAIYGATGVTGRLVALELSRRGVPVVLGGRNEEKLRILAEELSGAGTTLEWLAVAADDEPGLLSFLSGASVLISCAGPFGEMGEPLVRAALQAKVHYLDTAGEQTHIRWILENCHEEAKRNEQVLMPACAFEFALGDVVAELAWVQAASRIAVAYVIDEFTMSQGTKKSLVRSFGDGGLTFLDGEHQEKKVGYRLFDVPMPDGTTRKAAWGPGGEALTVPRRGGVSRVETCIAAGEATSYLVGTLSGLLPPVLKAVKPLADKWVEKSEDDPTSARDEVFYVVAFDPQKKHAFATLRGADIYRVTAQLISEAACRLMSGKKPRKMGFVGPADLFDVTEFLKAIDVELVEVERGR